MQERLVATMTIREALKNRIPRIRWYRWTNGNAYLRLPLLPNGKFGPWAELYDDEIQKAIGIRPGSQRIPMVGAHMHDAQYEAYTGLVSPNERNEPNFSGRME